VDKTYSLFLFGLILLTGCATAEKPKPQEAPPNPNALIVQPTPVPALPSTNPPPKLTEVQDAVKRVFKESAVIDTSRNPNFVVGDFNGDLSQDVAVILRPVAEELSDMNDDLPPWILWDPFVMRRPGMLPLRIAADEPLLAVIHGFGAEGWRDPQATQTYLLKNAVGPAFEVQPKTAVVTANRGKKMPQLKGDLIAEVLRGMSGYLYYDDAGYSWYDPKTFKEEPVKRVVHSGMAARK
jgi:hypothetical protein